ncbi:reactive mitochondrial oxygen species modulator 1-domain-containing protein [Daedaleopsis nitida]|nr:reactive mitochondrial oxygen species modulator 1-domain-containing protein [Daedaleopsis nitida]
MPPVAMPQGHAGPTVWQKLKMGAAMGAGVGLTMGFLFGGFSILRGGAGPRGVLPTLSQYMLGSAATFSFFLAIGSVRGLLCPPFPNSGPVDPYSQVIRNDGQLPPQLAAARQQLAPHIMRSRAEGLSSMRLQWAREKSPKSGSQ